MHSHTRVSKTTSKHDQNRSCHALPRLPSQTAEAATYESAQHCAKHTQLTRQLITQSAYSLRTLRQAYRTDTTTDNTVCVHSLQRLCQAKNTTDTTSDTTFAGKAGPSAFQGVEVEGLIPAYNEITLWVEHCTAWACTCLIQRHLYAAQRSVAQHGAAWHSMAQHGTAWHSMAQHGTAWRRMA